MKSNPIIHQFDPVIYPYKLWVTISNKMSTLQEKFLADDNKEMEGTLINSKARTCAVILKEYPKQYGAVIVFTDKKNLTPSIMAHEAYHAVKFLWEYIGETYPSEEATSYLLGWIVNCMDQVRVNKFK